MGKVLGFPPPPPSPGRWYAGQRAAGLRVKADRLEGLHPAIAAELKMLADKLLCGVDTALVNESLAVLEDRLFAEVWPEVECHPLLLREVEQYLCQFSRSHMAPETRERIRRRCLLLKYGLPSLTG